MALTAHARDVLPRGNVARGREDVTSETVRAEDRAVTELFFASAAPRALCLLSTPYSSTRYIHHASPQPPSVLCIAVLAHTISLSLSVLTRSFSFSEILFHFSLFSLARVKCDFSLAQARATFLSLARLYGLTSFNPFAVPLCVPYLAETRALHTARQRGGVSLPRFLSSSRFPPLLRHSKNTFRVSESAE